MAQIFIGQLPFSKFFPDDLLNLFRPYGNVVAHQLHIRQGNAFVTYATTDEADAAIRALHGQYALGTRSQPIQVMYSKGTRLISPFGLQHRSLCLARNKDRQKSKRGTSDGDAQSTSNNDSVSLNDGTLSAMSTLYGGAHPSDFATLIYTSGAEEMTGGGGAGMGPYYSRGPSDMSFDEEGRPVLNSSSGGGGSGVFSNAAMLSVTRQIQQQQQQQQQANYMTGMLGVDAMGYGAPVKWTLSPPGPLPVSAAPATGTATSMNGDGRVPSTGVHSSLSSPAAPSLPPPQSAPVPMSYVVMPPSSAGVGMPAGIPICYVMPTAAGPVYLPAQHHQQHQPSMNNMMGPFGAAAMMPSPLTCVQMRPM